MSIIYEALKKVEEKKSLESSEVEKVINDNSKMIKAKQPSKKSFFMLLMILVITLGVFILQKGGYLYPRKNEKLRARDLSILKKKILKPTVLVRKAFGRYVFEGVIYDEESPSAIINGKVLKESDQIDNFVVTDITKNSVKLIDKKNGTFLKLDLPF